MPPEPPEPPIPVAGTFAVGAGLLVLTFDRPLQPGPLALPNWDVQADMREWEALTMDAALPAANQVTGTYDAVAGLPPGTDVSYTPPPFDVLSVPGVPAAAFADFPIVEVP